MHLNGEKDKRRLHLIKELEKATLDHRLVPYPSKNFMVEMNDSSMSPIINKNDWLILEKRTQLKDKDIILVEYNEKAYLRRFNISDNGIILSSGNENIKSLIFSEKMFKEVDMLAVIIGIVKRSGF